MGLSYAHGAIQWLSADAVNTTYVISGLAFQPKALRFWWVGINSSTDATSTTADERRGMGFATSTSNRRSCGTLSFDNAATATCAAFTDDASIAATVNLVGAIDAQLDLNVIANDGFTAIVDDVIPANLTVFWEAWGGSDITVATAGDFATPAAGGNQSYTVTGFTAGASDQMLFFAGTQHIGSIPGGVIESSGFCLGATTGTDSTKNIMMGGNSVNLALTMDTDGWCHTGECLGMIPTAGGAALDMRATLSSFDTNAFTLNYLESAVVNRKFIFLAIKGGSWQAGSYTINNTTIGNTATVSGLPFAPSGLNLLGRGRAEQAADVTTTEDGLALGCGTSPTNRRTQGVADADAVATSEIRTSIRYASVLTTITNTTGDFDLNAMNSDGFQIIVQVVPATDLASEWQGYVAFGDAPVAGGAALMGQLVVVNP